MYTWTFDKELWTNKMYDTIEECLKDAQQNTYGRTIYIGEVMPHIFYIEADDILENLNKQAVYEVGDIVDGWPLCKNAKELEELSDALTECVYDWLVKRNDLPKFYTIISVTEVSHEKIQ